MNKSGWMTKERMNNPNYTEALRLLDESEAWFFNNKTKRGRSLKMYLFEWKKLEKQNPKLIERLFELADGVNISYWTGFTGSVRVHFFARPVESTN